MVWQPLVAEWPVTWLLQMMDLVALLVALMVGQAPWSLRRRQMAEGTPWDVQQKQRMAEATPRDLQWEERTAEAAPRTLQWRQTAETGPSDPPVETEDS